MTPGPWPAPPLPRPALSNSLQQLSLGAARRPPDRLLAAHPHLWPAAAPASLYMYKLPINRTAAIMLFFGADQQEPASKAALTILLGPGKSACQKVSIGLLG